MAAKTAVMVDVGRRLRELRERAGMPKEQVALALKMSASNWAHYESGRNQLAATMLPTLAELYGMTVSELAAELLDGTPGHTVSSSDYGRHNKHHANYDETESLNRDFAVRTTRPHASRIASTPTRELVAAGR